MRMTVETENPKYSVFCLPSNNDGDGLGHRRETEKNDDDAIDDVRIEKIIKARRLLEGDSYKIDSLEIADKLIEHMIDPSPRQTESTDSPAADPDPAEPQTPVPGDAQ